MLCRNEVVLQGRIGGDVLYRKTTDGRPYSSFCVNIEPPANKLERGSRSLQIIRVMVFDKALVEYLAENHAREGRAVYIEAYINSRSTERRGAIFVQNNVIARKIKFV